MEKKFMLHFFHERSYEPQSLEEFEREAAQAARAGALRRTHRAQRQWAIRIRDRVRYDRYWPAEPPPSVAAAFPELRRDRGSGA